jgi:hypothetical protein
VWLLASNPDDQGLHFIWPLPFDLSYTGGPTRSLRSRQHGCPRRRAQTVMAVEEIVVNMFICLYLLKIEALCYKPEGRGFDSR